MLIVLAAITCVRFACGQGTFRTEADVVQVPVTVKSSAGKPVTGLVASDFNVFDNGVLQSTLAEDIGAGSELISFVVAVQAAGISMPALAKIRRIGGMLQPLIAGERGAVAVISFDKEVVWRQEFTSDDAKIRTAIAGIKPGLALDAHMLDAVSSAAERLRDRPGRRIILLISETRDRGSQTRLENALEAVEGYGVQVFAVHYSAWATTWIARPEDTPDPASMPARGAIGILIELLRLGKENAVRALTAATGGEDYAFLRERSLENAVEQVGLEIHPACTASMFLYRYTRSSTSRLAEDIGVVEDGRRCALVLLCDCANDARHFR